jgi:pimeloyl-ACP methyl ester carboxylesterase
MKTDATNEVKLAQGTIRYRDEGEGPVIVFVHGLLVSGSVWRKVAAPLSKRFRCIAPDWPLGSHTLPMAADADLTPAGIARIVADFLEALDLRDVILVGNDSGGAICQLVVARHGERVGRLVLTTCDAFEVFPPRLFEYLKWVTRVPAVMALLGRSMLALPILRQLPIAYGIVTKHRIDEDVMTAWIRPAATNVGVRRDLAKFVAGVSKDVTMEVARELPGVAMPVLLVWTPEDRCFPLSLGKRLEKAFPDARLVLVDDAFVFVAEDRPEAVVSAIEAFVPSSHRGQRQREAMSS